MFKWSGLVRRMGNGRLVKNVNLANVEGNKGRGRPHTSRRWRDEVKELLMGDGMNGRER